MKETEIISNFIEFLITKYNLRVQKLKSYMCL